MLLVTHKIFGTISQGLEQVPDEQIIYSPEIDLWPQFHGIPRQAGDLDINMRFILQ